MASKWISRKELSTLTGFTVDRLRRNEEQLGLSKIKVKVNARTVLYYRSDALIVMKGYIALTALTASTA